MEFAINIDINTIAKQILKVMTSNVHQSVTDFVRQKFTPRNLTPTPPFPPQSPTPYSNFNQEVCNGGVSVSPHLYGQLVSACASTYYTKEHFKKYAELMDNLSTDEVLIQRLEQVLSTHIQEFLDTLPTT